LLVKKDRFGIIPSFLQPPYLRGDDSRKISDVEAFPAVFYQIVKELPRSRWRLLSSMASILVSQIPNLEKNLKLEKVFPKAPSDTSVYK